jgi:hypothetical protein
MAAVEELNRPKGQTKEKTMAAQAKYDPEELKEIDAQMEALEAADGKTPETIAACGKLLHGLVDSEWLTPLARLEIRERYLDHERVLGLVPVNVELTDEAIRAVVDAKITDVDAA